MRCVDRWAKSVDVGPHQFTQLLQMEAALIDGGRLEFRPKSCVLRVIFGQRFE